MEKLNDPLFLEKFLAYLLITRTNTMIILQMVHSWPMGGEKAEVQNNNHRNLLEVASQSHQLKFLGIIAFAGISKGNHLLNVIGYLHPQKTFTNFRNH